MSIVALITAILNLPATLNALLARIQSLEDAIAAMNKQKELAAIDKAQADTNAATTSDDLRKVAEENAQNLRNL